LLAVSYFVMRNKPVHDLTSSNFHLGLMDMVNKVNGLKTTWKAGHNDRWNFMGVDAIKGQMGSFLGGKKLAKTVKTVAAKIPDTFDARTAWPACESIGEIRDQANCGSCWAFGACEAMSDRICIASKGTRQDRISTQDMTTCCESCGMGCDGGYPAAAWEWWQETGVVTGALYGDTKFCQPYSLAPCDHHTTGKYNPCPAVVPTPECSSSCQDSYPTPYQ